MTSAETTFSPSLAQPQKSAHSTGYWLALAAMILLYVIIFAGLAFNQHAALRTHKSDLGQMDVAIWNTSHGRFVEEIKQDFISTRLTDHVEPIFIPVSAVFWLWDDVRAILLLQALAVALGAIPLFALARRKLGPTLALGFAAAYLLNPSLQSAVLTEFHAIPLAVPLILWAFWAISARRWWQFLIAALLVAAVKEEAALLAAGLGVWAMWRTAISFPKSKKGLTFGGAVVILSLIWFYLATFLIVPAYGAEIHRTAQSVYFERYGALGDSPLSILKNMLVNPKLVWSVASEPARVRYLLGLFASFGFLSLLGLDVLILALPVLLANLLSAYPAQYYGDFHYTAPLIPYFAVAAIYGLHRLLRFFRTTSVSRKLLLTVTLLWLLGWSGYVYAQAGRGPLGDAYDRAPITAHDQLLDRFLTQIPSDAPVTATAALEPHLTHRRFIYQFPYGLTARPPARPAEWALLDVTGDTDMAPGDLRDQVIAMLAGDWGVVDAADGYLLLRRGATTKTIPPAFFDFARTPDDPAARAQTYPLTFADITPDAWPRWRQVKITTEWLVGSDYQPGTVRPWMELRTPPGKLLYTYDQLTPPALIWYPPEQWQPGDRIRITTLPLHLPRYWGAGVGVVHGPDPFQPNHRLPAKDAAPGVSIQSVDGTLALAAAYQWDAHSRLQLLPPETLLAPDLGAQLAPDGQEKRVDFRTSDGALIPLSAWLPKTPPAPGRLFDFWLRWEQGVPQGYQPFVHLRHGGETIIQEDGPPTLFLVQPAQQPVNDWREFLIPADSVQPGEEIDLVAGLYNPETGHRLDILGPDGKLAGNEILLGSWIVADPPVPDQACALLSDTCLSQP
jgi:uncharacterized membrane protein